MSTVAPTDFFYQAHGVAVSGSITRPVSYNIDTAASVALPITGGAASSSAPATTHSIPQLGNVLSFSSATAQTTGNVNPDDSTYNTLITVTIENLNVLDTVTADLIVAKFSSKHIPGTDAGQIIPLGSHFENLKIAGHPITVEFDQELFSTYNTYAAFAQQFKLDAAFRGRVRKQFLWGDFNTDTPDFLKKRFQWHTDPDTPPESKGLVPCTLVKSVQHDQPNVLKTFGNVIIVPQFGKIFLGEMVMKPASRSLTMMRLDLGSPVDGDITIGNVTDNGQNWP